ncbi:MAG: protein translocase subunit SecF [Candidatus Aminicenantes bacterium]|nr:protein translocase subunit SecF [Candidatus Aminicenantes bacterium]NIM82785.1 protein translocase subunit SecF [Candidatus Aminicenantes bacterium]NIN22160.1 protein translocase subunit SecF [Candidatus Aminicenantes bacterium]NIN41157.1 protein translocase subunit SecF [Candidatus Aminicenantes bacterium]NIN88756.1 protein translocase subunit SecF [Candidatus Aminicenantes bacterium]
MRIFKEEPKFQFMNKRYYAFLFSGIIIALGVLLFFTSGFNLGIDFTGGTNIEVTFRKDITVNELRKRLGNVGLGKSTIQQVGQSENRFFIKTVKEMEEQAEAPIQTGTENEKKEGAEEIGAISKTIEEALITEEAKERDTGKMDLNNLSQTQIAGLLVSKGVPRDTAEPAAAKVIKLKESNSTLLINDFAEIEKLELKSEALSALKEHTYLGDFTFLSVETVGPQVGHDMREKVTLATIWAMIGMLIYIGFRFRFIFGIAAVITLFHDILITLTFLQIFQVEVSLYVVAGILTIVGYSLNDTIVIFDRVRDNLTLMKRQEAEKILDRSINQTLSRTIVTSGTTLCVVLALFFYGGEVLHAFSVTLLIGIITGTYSSIFQSCAWLRIWEQKFVRRKK